MSTPVHNECQYIHFGYGLVKEEDQLFICCGQHKYVIYNYVFIGMISHTYCPIHTHKSSMIINQTIINLVNFRYVQNYILDADGK